jgi:hypothetical protein
MSAKCDTLKAHYYFSPFNSGVSMKKLHCVMMSLACVASISTARVHVYVNHVPKESVEINVDDFRVTKTDTDTTIGYEAHRANFGVQKVSADVSAQQVLARFNTLTGEYTAEESVDTDRYIPSIGVIHNRHISKYTLAASKVLFEKLASKCSR